MGGDEQGLHGDALHLFIGQGKPRGLDTTTATVKRWRSLETLIRRRSFRPWIGSDARDIERSSGSFYASGTSLSSTRIVAYWLKLAVDAGEDDGRVFPLARFLKQAKR
jgi:hypothetical protein